MVKQIADEEGFPPEYCDIEIPDALGSISFEKELLEDDQIYLNKIERGKIISNILEKGSAREDSLSKNNKEALKFYRKQMSMRNLSNTELRIWQQQLMNNIYSPST